MRRRTRYLTALLTAAAVTAGVTLAARDVFLLTGIFVVYALAVAIALRYPALLRARDGTPSWASGAFAGGTTFGVLALAQGLGPDFHVGAAVLGYGLAIFGGAAGIWMAEDALDR